MSDNTWGLLEQRALPAAYNMALDEALLECAPEMAQPILRFYGWHEPAATFGYSQKFAEIARWTTLRPLIRRPTGGGLVAHDADWTYSIVIPPAHPWYALTAAESYLQAHQWVGDAFHELGVRVALAPAAKKELPGQCFIGYEKSDLLWHGRKIAGAAQRRTRNGLLIQGSVVPPPVDVNRVDWHQAMVKVASRQFAANWQNLTVSGMLAHRTAELEQMKYSQPAYNQKR
jgi:lipoate-protein ligase A